MTDTSVQATPPGEHGRRWPAKAILASAVVALILCLVAAGNAAAPSLPWWPWWQFVRIAGLIGFWLALVVVVLGLAVRVTALRRGTPEWRGLLALMLGVVALGTTGLAVWRVHAPIYWLHDVREPSTAELDALGPEGVVRAYFISQDRSVQYRLSDAALRACYLDRRVAQDLSLLAGVDDLRIASLRNSAHPADATHRSYGVDYRSRVAEANTGLAGPQRVVVDLARRPGRPWRVTYVGNGL